MPVRVAVAALLACALLSTGGAPASPRASRNLPAARTEPAAPRPVGPTGVVLPAADPMAVEMQRELERSQREYAELFQRLSLARTEDEAFAIQEEMRQQRTGLQIALLRIQAAYARRAGRNAFAGQLDRAVEALIQADPPRSAPDPRRGM